VEKWVDIKGFEGIYQVSDYGHVCSLDRLVWNKANKRHQKTTGRTLKVKVTKKGYVEVCLYDKDSKKHYFLVHRIVAEAFIQNPENKPQVNHENGVKSDNRADNLEWSTRKENMNHALKTGLTKIGSDSTSSKLTNNQVKEIRELFATKKYSFNELGRMFSVHGAGIGKIIKGKTWKHLPIIEYDFDIDKLERKRQSRPPAYTEEQIDEMIKLVSSGLSKRKVAEQFKVTHTTVSRYLKERAGV
jgi:predicted DNA-binding protein YlxM (UPF0122 family)